MSGKQRCLAKILKLKCALLLKGLLSRVKYWEKKFGIFSSPSYYALGNLEIVQIFDFRFLADLYVLGSGESKKHKISLVS